MVRRDIVKHGASGVVLAFLVVLAVGSAGGGSSQPAPKNRRPAVVSEAAGYCYEYSNNKLRAEEKFKDKYCEIAGTVTSVGREITGRPYVTLQGADGFDVQCVFPQNYTNALAQLSTGQRITNIGGTCRGELMGTIIFEDCTVFR